MAKGLIFRTARESDCSDLAVLADMAARRLTSYLWSLDLPAGQSVSEAGREAIRTQSGAFAHYPNWQVGEVKGTIVGGLNAHTIERSPLTPKRTTVTQTTPLSELKNLAIGTWYIATAAILNEYQGQGYGSRLLERAAEQGAARNANQLTLIVGSFNEGAHRLYLRHGFKEWDRRPFIPFAGSDQSGEWILMGKTIG